MVNLNCQLTGLKDSEEISKTHLLVFIWYLPQAISWDYCLWDTNWGRKTHLLWLTLTSRLATMRNKSKKWRSWLTPARLSFWTSVPIADATTHIWPQPWQWRAVATPQGPSRLIALDWRGWGVVSSVLVLRHLTFGLNIYQGVRTLSSPAWRQNSKNCQSKWWLPDF